MTSPATSDLPRSSSCPPSAIAFSAIRDLIEQEQVRNADFIRTALPAYLDKLEARAEFVAEAVDGICHGFVAFYCNDYATRILYVTLILVAPTRRRTRLGERLLTSTFELARARGFLRCRLEVHPDNPGARDFYARMGFKPIDARSDAIVLERTL
ncbi:GNAT family N-acetyltransferase [Burkholderia cenocepacia]|uniref:GNAT family N-acetyltransferase n=1 Tax=Burkholderia cenocepacia TaxID=95486 RepID=UPI002231880B|nr:GNAT family N-acetyltransferase [Burkholderia cenocepacia]MCW3501900.1 GNAT family N-acetyltransferase [Burkholderia cenocepacia]MCW3511481.1 GNAT family N-acetyltransferase [Burkholderia cenocepacia]MCW3517020.1 GNAT family N-acetyltransferase [Burkholderia cenocepacia]MCW3532533.1 GNAT family N-acetyltransferase [Burkholderia cenocepacia]MCW3547766.1 GNAT family N-acetyltransferase [Burkholderia cenocepacia]